MGDRDEEAQSLFRIAFVRSVNPPGLAARGGDIFLHAAAAVAVDSLMISFSSSSLDSSSLRIKINLKDCYF